MAFLGIKPWLLRRPPFPPPGCGFPKASGWAQSLSRRVVDLEKQSALSGAKTSAAPSPWCRSPEGSLERAASVVWPRVSHFVKLTEAMKMERIRDHIHTSPTSQRGAQRSPAAEPVKSTDARDCETRRQTSARPHSKAPAVGAACVTTRGRSGRSAGQTGQGLGPKEKP